ncbi:hypothetical protein [uncultured Mucilaginibacter sp.]|uniref:hypothetical protein n=1 Tax=uncultured Mucilaginibacter sp. TaxID=797541 RepID=UPI0025CE4D76|nr:hypothetical protein [uncultured Mucilaginibacter sp.]
MNVLLRILSIILGSILGGFMLFNGTYELLTGEYFGSFIPRPWVDMVSSFGISAFALGPFFLVYGGAWLYFVSLLWKREPSAFLIGLAVCVLTLWYFPFGTSIAFIVFCLLMSNKKPSGLLHSSKY